MLLEENDRRLDLRYTHPGRVTVAHLESGLVSQATIQDVSLGGCSVELCTNAFFLEGMVVELNFSTENLDFRALGTIRHYDAAARRLGVAFVILSKRGLIDMETLMLDLDKYRYESRSVASQDQIHPDLHTVSSGAA